MTMKPEVKDAWLAKLRSGEVEQGRRNLATRPVGGGTAGYCCLGVLTELAVEAGVQPPAVWKVEEVWDDEDRTYVGREVAQYMDSTLSLGFNEGTLPAAVVQWAGLERDNPYFLDGEGVRDFLAAMNDRGATFNQIADVIEEADI